MMKKNVVIYILIAVVLLSIAGFWYLAYRNHTKQEFEDIVLNKTAPITARVEQISSDLENEKNILTEKYENLSKALEEVPRLDKLQNNQLMAQVIKKSFSLVSYIGQKKRANDKNVQDLLQLITQTKNSIEQYVSSKRNIFIGGICDSAIVLSNKNSKDQLEKIEKEIQSFNSHCEATLFSIASLYVSYMEKMEGDISDYIREKTSMISEAANRSLLILQEQKSDLKDKYEKLHEELNEESHSHTGKIETKIALAKIKKVAAFRSLIKEQEKQNRQIKEDLSKTIQKSNGDIDVFFYSIDNAVIEGICEKEKDPYHVRVKRIEEKMTGELADSDQDLEELTGKSISDTLIYTTSIANEWVLNDATSSLIKFNQGLSKFKDKGWLKPMKKKVKRKIDFISRLKNKTLFPEMLTIENYNLLKLMEAGKNKSISQHARNVLNSAVSITSMKYKIEKEGVYFGNTRFQDKHLFKCYIRLKNRLSFPIDASILLKGKLVVKSTKEKPTGLMNLSNNIISKLSNEFIGREFDMMGTSMRILGNIVGADDDYQDTHLINDVPSASSGGEWVTLWSVELSRNTPVKFFGSLNGAKASIVSWEPSKW